MAEPGTGPDPLRDRIVDAALDVAEEGGPAPARRPAG